MKRQPIDFDSPFFEQINAFFKAAGFDYYRDKSCPYIAYSYGYAGPLLNDLHINVKLYPGFASFDITLSKCVFFDKTIVADFVPTKISELKLVFLRNYIMQEHFPQVIAAMKAFKA